jgi:NAD(P)-dependent dehydrogenase (short-subunit alcohol dehydrogenase family)
MAQSNSTDKTVVLITGANQGIGLAVAASLAREHDCHVLLGSRDASKGAAAVKEIETSPSTTSSPLSIEALTIDLTDHSTITAAAEQIKKTHGRIDVLINNAGISQHDDDGPTSAGGVTLNLSAMQANFATNVVGTAAVTETFLPLLSASSHPRIVFMSTGLSSLTHRANMRGAWCNVGCQSYRVSKAALNMLAMTYHARFFDKGWKVNVCCPGWTKTNLNFGMGEQTVEEARDNVIRLALLDSKGESGTFSDKYGPVPW